MSRDISVSDAARQNTAEVSPSCGPRADENKGSDGGAAGAEVGFDDLGDVEGEDLGAGFIEVEAVLGADVFELVVTRVLHDLGEATVEAGEPLPGVTPVESKLGDATLQLYVRRIA